VENRSAKELAEMQKIQDLQDSFLNQVRKDRSVITVFLMNGFQFRGVVRGYDAFTWCWIRTAGSR
jgi:RNA chaperone Hfq